MIGDARFVAAVTSALVCASGWTFRPVNSRNRMAPIDQRIRPGVDLGHGPDGLLRSHERGRAEDHPRARRLGRARLAQACDAEVEDLHGRLGRPEQVVGLEVAVNDAVLVRVLERLEHLKRDPQHLAERQAAPEALGARVHGLAVE